MVDIIIRALDGRDMTSACVLSVRENTPDDQYRLILVQSGKNVLPRSVMRRQDCYLRSVMLRQDCYLHSEEPVGAVTATNMGIEVSLAGDAEHIMVMDNDTEVPKGDTGWLKRFVTELEQHPDTGAVGATSSFVNAPQQILACPATYTGDWSAEGKSGVKDNPPSVWFVSFCVLMRSAVVRELGLWDVRYDPGNWEDTDYALQMRVAGYPVRVARSVYIHHKGHATFGKDMNTLMHNNKQKFFLKWGFGRLWDLGLVPDGELMQILQYRSKHEAAV